MSAFCPACGVAVVPGYVRCPKCHRPLPASKRGATVAGGTSVAGGGGLPILPIIAGGVVVLGLVLFFALRGGDDKPAAAKPTDTTADEAPDNPADPSPTPLPTVDEPQRDPNRVDPSATARDLERALKNQRLWADVEVVGSSVEVTSGSCRDENMIPMVDAARTALRNAGLTRLRCRENNGAVVFEREL